MPDTCAKKVAPLKAAPFRCPIGAHLTLEKEEEAYTFDISFSIIAKFFNQSYVRDKPGFAGYYNILPWRPIL